MTVSNLGAWMHDLGASWLMVNLTSSSLMVALVQTATTFPFFLLVLPAGTLADILDRRKYMLFTIIWMMIIAAILGISTFTGITTPWMLLALTSSIGLGNALLRPAWSASIVDFIPKEEMRSAVTLNSMSQNISRAAGPALAGVLILAAGPAIVFIINTLTFFVLFMAIYRWERVPVSAQSSIPVERFFEGILAGIRYVRYSPTLKALLVRCIAFFFFASVTWALLPVIAVRVLQAGPSVYGLMMAVTGIGAVLGVMVLPYFNRQYSRNNIVMASAFIYAGSLLALAFTRNLVIINIILLFTGATWLSVFASIMVASQLAIPNWLRARGLAISMLALMGSLALGSAVWGQLADMIGASYSISVAAIGLIIATLATLKFRIKADDHLDLTPSVLWPSFEVSDDIEDEQGPVMVTIKYQIPPEHLNEFMQLIQKMHRMRKRGGALFWELFSDLKKPDEYIEVFMVNSWLEHLRQHERITVTDRGVISRLKELHTGPNPPVVSHLVAVSEEAVLTRISSAIEAGE